MRFTIKTEDGRPAALITERRENTVRVQCPHCSTRHFHKLGVTRGRCPVTGDTYAIII